MEIHALMEALNKMLEADGRKERFEYCEEAGWDESENWHGIKLDNPTEPKNSIYISYDCGEFTVEYLGTHEHIQEDDELFATVKAILEDRVIAANKFKKNGKWCLSQITAFGYLGKMKWSYDYSGYKLSRDRAEEKAYLKAMEEKYDIRFLCWSGEPDEETKFKAIRNMMESEKKEIPLSDEVRQEVHMYCKQNYLHFFFDKFDYPEEARKCLISALQRIYGNTAAAKKLEQLLSRYRESMNCDYKGMIEEMKSLSGETGINEHTGYLLMFVLMSEILRDYYKERGVDSDMWKRCMFDLKYKLLECRAVYGNWGTFVPGWFPGFFNMTRFAFEKLQFEAIRFGEDYSKNGVVLTPDSTVLNVHIPRTGTRLDRESVDRAYAQAKEFFSDKFIDRPTVFVCDSWLLFPRHKEMLKPWSNLLSFISDYDIIRSGEYKDYHEVWRLFDMNYTPDLSKLPADTSLRRSYIELMKIGEKTGWGRGVYIYG